MIDNLCFIISVWKVEEVVGSVVVQTHVVAADWVKNELQT